MRALTCGTSYTERKVSKRQVQCEVTNLEGLRGGLDEGRHEAELHAVLLGKGVLVLIAQLGERAGIQHISTKKKANKAKRTACRSR